MSALKWSSKAPDKPGWWWMQRGVGQLAYALPMQVVKMHGGLEVHLCASDDASFGEMRNVNDVKGVRWAGPIPEPEVGE